MVANMGLVFITEELDGSQHGICRRTSQRSQRSVLHHAADFLKQLDIALFAAAFANLVENVAHLPQAFAARRAFSAAFLVQEVNVVARNLHHAAAIVHDNHAAGAHHGAVLGQRIKINRQVQQAFGNAAARRTARLNGFEGAVIDNAAAFTEPRMWQAVPLQILMMCLPLGLSDSAL